MNLLLPTAGLAIAGAVVCLLSVLYFARLGRLKREMDLRFERMRVARELHETLLQSLQRLVVSLSHLTAQVDAASDVRKEMELALEQAEEMLVSGRKRMRDLHSDSKTKFL
jgi:nitrate/nitrite-specific signal transduction histidine kinase